MNVSRLAGRRLALLALLSVQLPWTVGGCAGRQPAVTQPPPPPFHAQLMATEFALCDAADAYQRHVGRWPRSTDELKDGAAWAGLEIEPQAFAHTILHEGNDGRLVLEFVREGGSIYATKMKPPPTEPSK